MRIWGTFRRRSRRINVCEVGGPTGPIC